MDAWRKMLAEAVDKHGCAGVARIIGVSRTAVSLLKDRRYPGKEDLMAARIIKHFGRIACPYLGQDVPRSQCARHCGGEAPTSSPAALRHWRAGQKCGCRPQEGCDEHS